MDNLIFKNFISNFVHRYTRKVFRTRQKIEMKQSWVNINNLPGTKRVEAWKAGVKSHDLDDFGDKRSAAFREIEERNSSPCKGHVNLNDILSGKCGNVKIKVEE